ncbi:MAG TPA: tetratricopeptide repeat protein [Blastocatellia bacterium]|nr:tetratricopeptide repeat protein [Blastocatellia bacterium]HMZ17863.1 tetratricopeptide repeat protein [Blastocatellia bacterium]HNG32387.1 tetratricopeptide repeat protein [Blastocatellia bacterium]
MKTIVLFSWLLIGGIVAAAQPSVSIQFFLPGGSLPAQKLRFTLALPDRRSEILFTDAAGRFSFPKELLAEGDYRVVIESDKRTHGGVMYRFRLSRTFAGSLPVFLQPLNVEDPPKTAAGIKKSLTDYDAKASPEAVAAYGQAMKYAAEGKTNEAVSEFTRALTSYPQYLSALNELGLLYLKQNRLSEAATAFTQAVSLNSGFHSPLLNLAQLSLRRQDFNEAVRRFDQLLTEHPTLSAARIAYADALSATQQWDEAETQLREALKDSTLGGADRAIAHLKLGGKLNRDERYKSAAVEFEKAVKLSPESAAARLFWGTALMQLNQSPDAERELLKAYQLGGKNAASAQLQLGELYRKQQKPELAIKAFEQFLADAPTAPNAEQVRQTVGELKAGLKK